MINKKLKKTLQTVVSKRQSILICGLTGVGKTEMQKYILGLLNPHQRVVIIDQGVELAICSRLYPELDLSFWRYDERNEHSALPNLIKTSLRFHPDYLVIAEARGSEIRHIYDAALSGHPTIMTVHAESETQVYERMLVMGMFPSFVTVKHLQMVFPYVIYLSKTTREGKIVRQVKTVVNFGTAKAKGTYLYSNEEEEN